MFKQIPPSEGPFLGLHITGDVSRSETDQLVHLIGKRYGQHGPVRLLVAYDAEPGLISAEDLYDNMRFAKIASDKLAKMAVVGRYAWQDTWIGLFGLFGGIKAQYFDPSEIEEALTWLGE